MRAYLMGDASFEEILSNEYIRNECMKKEAEDSTKIDPKELTAEMIVTIRTCVELSFQKIQEHFKDNIGVKPIITSLARRFDEMTQKDFPSKKNQNK